MTADLVFLLEFLRDLNAVGIRICFFNINFAAYTGIISECILCVVIRLLSVTVSFIFQGLVGLPGRNGFPVTMIYCIIQFHTTTKNWGSVPPPLASVTQRLRLQL